MQLEISERLAEALQNSQLHPSCVRILAAKSKGTSFGNNPHLGSRLGPSKVYLYIGEPPELQSIFCGRIKRHASCIRTLTSNVVPI